MAKDKSGHEHKGAGEGGGQFTSGGSGGGGAAKKKPLARKPSLAELQKYGYGSAAAGTDGGGGAAKKGGGTTPWEPWKAGTGDSIFPPPTGPGGGGGAAKKGGGTTPWEPWKAGTGDSIFPPPTGPGGGGGAAKKGGGTTPWEPWKAGTGDSIFPPPTGPGGGGGAAIKPTYGMPMGKKRIDVEAEQAREDAALEARHKAKPPGVGDFKSGTGGGATRPTYGMPMGKKRIEFDANNNPLTGKMHETISKIAKDLLDRETLGTRGSDSLDFKQHHVSAINSALRAAFVAGKAMAGGANGIESSAIKHAARRHLGIDSLQPKNSDREDFKDVSAEGVRAALASAHDSGRTYAQRQNNKFQESHDASVAQRNKLQSAFTGPARLSLAGPFPPHRDDVADAPPLTPRPFPPHRAE